MEWLKLFRSEEKNSASLARDRLRVIVAHQRAGRLNGPAYLPRLQQDLLAVVRKYVTVGDDAIRMNLESDNGLDVLELNITLPEN